MMPHTVGRLICTCQCQLNSLVIARGRRGLLWEVPVQQDNSIWHGAVRSGRAGALEECQEGLGQIGRVAVAGCEQDERL